MKSRKHISVIIPVVILQVVFCLFNSSNNPQPPEDPVEKVFSDDTVGINDLKWPTVLSSDSPCTNQQLLFEIPDLPLKSGEINISVSSELQPTGATEKLEIEVKSGYQSSITLSDTIVQLLTDTNTSLIKITALKDGKATALVRFITPGIHTVKAKIIRSDDTLSGSVSVMAYVPSLPIAEMEISDNDMATILKSPYEKIKVPAVLTYKGVKYDASVRIHGGSSRDYPKKSFRFDLADGLTLPGNNDHIILRAEWNDKTMLRNYISMETARYGTWLPVPETELIHFRINQRYYGVMWKVERIDADFLRARGLNSNDCSLYEADPDTPCFGPGADLSPFTSIDQYQCAYKLQKGAGNYTDLISLIETTLQLPETEFITKINDIIRVNDMLVYFAVMAVIQNQDHLKKNYYLYHTTSSSDNRWTVFPWDLELTFGHLWTQQNDVLDETIFYNAPLETGALKLPFNTLFVRLYNVPTYRKRFYEMVLHILNNVFTDGFIESRINNILCTATPDILGDNNKRSKNSEYLQRVEEIRQFVTNRRNWILAQLDSTGNSLDK